MPRPVKPRAGSGAPLWAVAAPVLLGVRGAAESALAAFCGLARREAGAEAPWRRLPAAALRYQPALVQRVWRALQRLHRHELVLLAVLGAVALGLMRLLIPGGSSGKLGAMGGDAAGGCGQRRGEVRSAARCQVAAAGGCRRAPAQSQGMRCLRYKCTRSSSAPLVSAAFKTGTPCLVQNMVWPAFLLLLKLAFLLLLNASRRLDSGSFKLGCLRRLPVRRWRRPW